MPEPTHTWSMCFQPPPHYITTCITFRPSARCSAPVCEETQSFDIFQRVADLPTCRFNLSSLCLVPHHLTVYWHCCACLKQRSAVLHKHTHTHTMFGPWSLRPAVCHWVEGDQVHCVPMFVWGRDRPDLVCRCVYVFVCDFPGSQPCSALGANWADSLADLLLFKSLFGQSFRT